MNLLLAPNGKPSNLTPEQYKLVRTPSFKEWFGDWENSPETSSKVIDENGEPLVVYHGYLVGGGAGRKFYEFKKLPAFFSKTKKFAYDYASTKSMDAGIDADIDTYACFLNIKKLFDSKNKENIKLAEEQLPEKIEVSHGTMWFLSAYMPKEEVIEQMTGIITIPTDDLSEDILSSNVGDIIAEKVSQSQYENKILLYKDEDWGYITDAQRFAEIVHNEIAEWVNNDYEKTIKYKGKYLKTFILIEGTYKLELNKDPLFLEFQNEVEKRKKYYIDNILKLLKQSHNLTITIKDKTGYPMNFYVQKINLKTYKTTTKNNWTMFENETLQKFLIDNNFGGWFALEKGDKTYGVYNANNIKLADGTNTTFDVNNPDIRFEEGGNVNWDADRYRQVEKEMYDLQQQGKTDSAEYFKLIKERSILEKNKMETQNKSEENMDNYSTDEFAKGGKIIVKEINENGNVVKVHQDYEKFKRIGITDKYIIESSNDVGLQGVVFSKEQLDKKIELNFNKLLETYSDYLINTDSENITFYIETKIKTMQRGGSSLEAIAQERLKINNPLERQIIIDELRKNQDDIVKMWVAYFGESDYPIAFKYLMFKAVLTYNYDLKKNKLIQRTNETTRNFTNFDAGSLAELFYQKSNYLLYDYIHIMNENSIRIFNSKEVINETENGKWIKFNGDSSKTPSQEIQINAKELSQLVQGTNWCTKTNSLSQLGGGDFYVYVTINMGEVTPQIAVRMSGLLVGEVRGDASASQDLTAEMLPIAKRFLLENVPNNSGKKWLDSIEYNERCVEIGERFVNEGLYEDFIYDYIKLISEEQKWKVDYGQNGNVSTMIQRFEEAKERLPNQYYERGDIESNYLLISPLTKYFMGDLGRYEMQMLSSQNINLSDLSNWKLKYISGQFNCADIVTTLGNIEFVGKDLTLSQITNDFGSVKHIGGRFDMGSAQITSLVNIESIGSGFVVNSNLTDLGKLKKVGWLSVISCGEKFTFGDLEEVIGDLTIKVSDKNFDVGNLKKVGGSFDASKTLLTDLKGLESVGQDFSIAGSKIKLFENLKSIGGNADFSNNFSSSTQNIESILGSVKLLNSRIMEFPKLNVIGGTIELRGSYLKSFGNIKSIGTNLDLVDGKIEDLGNLEEINGFVNFKGSQVKSLNKLKKIVSFANFSDSLVEDLGNLESIGGNAYFNDTKIKSIGKLNYIGGFAKFDGNPSLEEQWLKVKNTNV